MGKGKTKRSKHKGPWGREVRIHERWPNEKPEETILLEREQKELRRKIAKQLKKRT